MHNDRFIAVSSNYRLQQNLNSLNDLAPHLVEEIEHFFISYKEIKGKQFNALQRSRPERALELIRAGQADAE